MTNERVNITEQRTDPRLRWLVAALILLALGIVVTTVLMITRIDRLSEEVAVLRTNVAGLDEVARSARDKSDLAISRAEESEQLARISAEGRMRAESLNQQNAARAALAEEMAESAASKAAKAQEELERLRKEREAETNRLQAALNRVAETRRTSQGLVMNLGSDTINFEFDKADLRPSERELLSRIAGILLTSKGYRIQVYGHTDDVGTEEYNQRLSERRAQAVRDYLVQAGIDPSIITSQGFGKSNPLVNGSTPDARAKNRRVEIGIIDTLVTYRGVGEGSSSRDGS